MVQKRKQNATKTIRRREVGAGEYLDELTRHYTGYDSFEEMCRNYPTLMVYGSNSIKRIEHFAELRMAYWLATGKQAYPPKDF